ncbi:Methyltransf_7 domain-containing protein, partial [Cephalotus follicularis]
LKQICSSSHVFNIADLGCSVGPNTFTAVQNIIEAVLSKYKSQGLLTSLEFQVFFNDHIENDFHTLFKSLPPYRNYFAAGAPGTFYGRLFPKATMHFVHSSYALNWLSIVPNEVQDKNSPTWDKGRIFYESKEVKNVYAAQFDKDIGSFLDARAMEIVCGGFMAIILPSIREGADPLKCSANAVLHLLFSTLFVLHPLGYCKHEAEVDSFNLPLYIPSLAELEAVIKRNGCFKVERTAKWNQTIPQASVEKVASSLRSVNEGVIRGHFGSELIDDLFNLFTKKLIDSGLLSDSSFEPPCELFVLLRLIDNIILKDDLGYRSFNKRNLRKRNS